MLMVIYDSPEKKKRKISKKEPIKRECIKKK